MSIVRLTDRQTGGSIVADNDDDDFDNIINELNTHTAAANPHTGSLAKTADTITGIHSFGSAGYLNNLKFKTHSDYASSESLAYTYATSTTDATETSLTTWTLTDTYGYIFDARVTARMATEHAQFFVKYGAYRDGGSATETLANVVDAYASTTTMRAMFDCSGNTVRLRIVGKAGTTIYWVASVAYQAVSTNA